MRPTNRPYLRSRRATCAKKTLASPAGLLTVVVPVYNEAEALPSFLEELAALAHAEGWRVVIVDDGSKDATPGILEAYQSYPGIKLARHKVNRGYGGTLKTGISLVETPYLVTVDGDGQHDLSDIKRLFVFALQEDADLVIGARSRTNNRLTLRDVGKWIIRRFARLLMPVSVSNLNSGFKLYRTELARRYMRLCPDTMAFSDIITLVLIHRRRLVLEHPIAVRQRLGGKSTINAYTAFETILAIINMAVMFNPLRIFLPLAAFCMLIGVLWGGRILLLGRGVSVGSLLAVVVGLWLITIGFVAAQISAFRMESLEDYDNHQPF